MKTAISSHGFVSHLLVYSLVAIGFTGSVGLGTVWTRRQISLVANENKALVATLAEVDRRSEEAAEQIAAEEDPANLEQRNIALRLGLHAPVQLVRVSDDPEAVLAAKNNHRVFTDGESPVSFRLTPAP